MNERDFVSIGKFVSNQEAADLFVYFEVSREADSATVEAAIRSRRAWAQGQQANPKYRQTALWLIKNVALCRRALDTERAEYLAHLNAEAQAEALEILGNVMDGAVFNRRLSVEREEAVLDRGVQLGLSDEAVEQFIEDYLDRHEARRESPAEFVDNYALLGVEKEASIEDIEAAVARCLAKSQGAGPSASRRRRDIRRAARIFRSAELRSDYDAEWEDHTAAVPGLAAPNERETQLNPQHGEGIQLRTSADEDSDSTEIFQSGGLSLKNQAPPAPKALGGRTIGATTGSIRRPTGGPRFEILGDSQRTVKVGRSPKSIEIVIRSTGDARLHGRVMADRGWIKVSPDRLDPDRKEQTITVTIDPTGLTRNRAVALCTIIADRGTRKSVTITAERSGIKPRWIAFGALVAVGGATAAAWPAISEMLFPPPPPPPPSATLHVEVDPLAGEIHVDGRLISAGGEAQNITGLPINRSVPVRIILDGFQTWEKELQLEDGQDLTIRPKMILTDPMDFDPEADDIQGKMDGNAVSQAIRSRGAEIQACIEEHEPGEPRVERKLEILAHVLAAGHIGSVSFKGNQTPSAGAAHCIKRQLRSLRLPFFQGDYDIARETFIVSFPGTEPVNP